MPWRKVDAQAASVAYSSDHDGYPVIGTGSRTMVFYKCVYTVYTPGTVPAGVMAIEVSADATGNIHYEEPAYSYIVY